MKDISLSTTVSTLLIFENALTFRIANLNPMFRRILYVLAVFTMMSLMSVGCCDNLPPYSNIKGISLSLSETEPKTGAPSLNEPTLINGSRTSVPMLIASMQLKYDYEFAVSQPTRFSFIGSAVANSCLDCLGCAGLKDQVATVTLISKGLFNGEVAGKSLNNFVQCRTYDMYGDTLNFSLSSLADSLNKTWGGGRGFDLEKPINLRISPKPRDNAQQQFELRIRLKSGKQVTQTTPVIIWE